MIKVFVYGTLKKGFSNHSVMERAKGTFLAETETVDKFTMVDCGYFPGVIYGDDYTIKGEVYEVENLDHLDGLEGYPDHYGREQVLLANGYRAWVYILVDAESLVIMEEGVWK